MVSHPLRRFLDALKEEITTKSAAWLVALVATALTFAWFAMKRSHALGLFIVAGGIVGCLVGATLFYFFVPDKKQEALTDPDRPHLKPSLVLDNVTGMGKGKILIQNDGDKIAIGVKVSVRTPRMTAAAFEPTPMSQIQPGMTITHQLPPIPLGDGPFSLDLKIEYAIPESPKAGYQSDFRFVIGRDDLKPGTYLPAGATYDGTVPPFMTAPDVENILSNLSKLQKQLASNLRDDTNNNRICLLAQLRIPLQPSARKRFIFDLGKLATNRISLFVADKNRLCFSVSIDGAASTTVSIPLDTEKPAFHAFAASLTVANRTARIRLSMQGGTRDDAEFQLPNASDPSSNLPPFLTDEFITGADLQGQNAAIFDLSESVVFSAITDENIDRASAALDIMPVSKYVEFKGKQWMHRIPNGNLQQGVAALKPTFRIIKPAQ